MILASVTSMSSAGVAVGVSVGRTGGAGVSVGATVGVAAATAVGVSVGGRGVFVSVGTEATVAVGTEVIVATGCNVTVGVGDFFLGPHAVINSRKEMTPTILSVVITPCWVRLNRFIVPPPFLDRQKLTIFQESSHWFQR
jgi:hypothetical protein